MKTREIAPLSQELAELRSVVEDLSARLAAAEGTEQLDGEPQEPGARAGPPPVAFPLSNMSPPKSAFQFSRVRLFDKKEKKLASIAPNPSSRKSLPEQNVLARSQSSEHALREKDETTSQQKEATGIERNNILLNPVTARRPTSLYAYGMFHILNGETLRQKLRGGALLLGLFFFSLTVAFALWDTAMLRWTIHTFQNQEGWAVPRERFYPNNDPSMHGFDKSYFGTPNIEVVLVVLFSLWFSAVARQEDEESLSCARPGVDTHFGVRLLWEVGFTIRFVVQPVLAVTSAAFIMNMSEDAVDMILNVLSVVFLFDLDNAFYLLVLSEEERQKYQNAPAATHTQLADLPEGHKRNCLRGLDIVSVGMMVWIYGLNFKLLLNDADILLAIGEFQLSFVSFFFLRSATYEVVCVCLQEFESVQDSRKQSTSCSWKRLLRSVSLVLLQTSLRSFFAMAIIFLIHIPFGSKPYVIIDSKTYGFSADLRACVVDGKGLACRLSH